MKRNIPILYFVVFRIQFLVEKLLLLFLSIFKDMLVIAIPKLKFQLSERHIINERQNLEIASAKNQDWIWVYCSSAGEFEQSLSLIEKHSNEKLLIIFHSMTGYNHVSNGHPYAAQCNYLLSELYDSKFLSELYELTNPKCSYIIKHEFWATYIQFCAAHHINLKAIDVLFRENSSLVSTLVKKAALYQCDQVEVVNTYSKRKYKYAEVKVDTKIAAIKLRLNHLTSRRSMLSLYIPNDDRTVLVLGSAFYADIEYFISVYDYLKKRHKIIIIPHQIEAQKLIEIYSLFSSNDIEYVVQVQIDKAVQWNNILIFSIQGWLLDLYSYAQVCWVGGGFCQGVHNVLEPVMQGKRTVCGPRLNQQKEAIDCLFNGSLKILPLNPQTTPPSWSSKPNQ